MITYDTKGTTLHIQLDTERLEAANIDAFKAAIKDLPLRGVEHVVLDVMPLHFIDSSGIGALLGILKRSPDKVRKLEIENAAPAIANIVAMLRLNEVLVCHR